MAKDTTISSATSAYIASKEHEAAQQAQTSVELVTAPDLDINAVLHMAMRGTSIELPHKVTWFTGNNKCRTVEGKPLPDIMGWAIEQPDVNERFLQEDEDLYDAMEALCAAQLAHEVIVQHPASKGQPARTVRYWSLLRASLFVVCEGVPTKYEMEDPNYRWGVAYAWPAGGSQLHFRCFIKELMDVGYNHAFKVRLSSYMTDKMLTAMKSHERVLNYADRYRREQGAAEVPFYGYALPVVCSERSMTAGTEEGKTKEVYYPIAAHPRKLSIEYLASIAVTEDQALNIEANDFVQRTVAWSILISKRILNGEDVDAEPGQVVDANMPPPHDVQYTDANIPDDIPESLR